MATAYTTNTRSYIGKGIWYIHPKAGGAYLPIGNISAASLTSEEDKKTLAEFRYAGGGIKDSLIRVGEVTGTLTTHDFSPENLAIALRATSTAVASATVTDEAHNDVTAGSLIATDFVYDPSIPVVVEKGGPALTLNTDYTLVPAGIQLVAGGAVVTGDDITITYTKNKSVILQGLTTSQLEYSLLFDGLNEVDSGNPVIVRVHRAKFSPSSLDLIGDDFGELELNFDILSDDTITGTGLSKFFTVQMVA